MLLPSSNIYLFTLLSLSILLSTVQALTIDSKAILEADEVRSLNPKEIEILEADEARILDPKEIEILEVDESRGIYHEAILEGDETRSFDPKAILVGDEARGIKPRQENIRDKGYGGCMAGWYDVQGQGVANDYCRWVGNCGCRGSCSFWSCALAGSTEQYSPKGKFSEPEENLLWNPDGRCGKRFPLADGTPSQCDPKANANEKGPCCSGGGWCGNTSAHCRCKDCVNYQDNDLPWHVDGRCGKEFPLADGTASQCDPEANAKDKGPCCSADGRCGNTWGHCECKDCVNYGDESSMDFMKCDNSVAPKNPDCSADQEKYCKLSKDNTMCKYCGLGEKCKGTCALGITEPEDIATLVDRHNELRRKVAKGLEEGGREGKKGLPSAANMMEVQWDPEVAKMAQTWVDQCIWGHDARGMESGYCGQNGGWAAGTASGPSKNDRKNIAKFVDMWYGEVNNFDSDGVASFGKGNNTGTVGHFTQVIWAKVTKIGCGYRYYNDGAWFGAYVFCNYCEEGGNWSGAQIYKEGEPGSECPEGSSNNDGLCKLD